ncbi:MAG: hypothetical protein KGI38_12430 [Thaumarchaeota archaeon]|nr:hypothetical protein [Nitrososphaerota archaeon]
MAALRSPKVPAPHIPSPQKRRDLVTWIASIGVICVSLPFLVFFIHKDYPRQNGGTVTVVTDGPAQATSVPSVSSPSPETKQTPDASTTKTTPTNPPVTKPVTGVTATASSVTDNPNAPGPCLLFTEKVCKNGKAIASPNGLAVAFYVPPGATIFAPTDGKFWTLKDGSIFLSANNSDGLPLPTATFVGSNGSTYQLALLGKWNFTLTPPEQGNHAYKQGEAVGTVTPADGYIMEKGLPPGYDFNITNITGKENTGYMSPFLNK